MKRIILILGSLATLTLAILWYMDKITEPLVAIGTGILTAIGYILTPEEKQQNKTVIKQKHTGSGDNVGGNKTINN